MYHLNIPSLITKVDPQAGQCIWIWLGKQCKWNASSILHVSCSLQLAALWGDILSRKDKVYTDWWVTVCNCANLVHFYMFDTSKSCSKTVADVIPEQRSSFSQELLSSLSRWATERVEQFTPQQLAGLVWSCAKMLEGEKPLVGMVKWWDLGFLFEAMVVGLKAAAFEEDSAVLFGKHCDQANLRLVGGL